MEQEEIKIKNNKFENLGVVYDCKYAIKRDIELILAEAERSHLKVLKELYDINSLRPYKARVFFKEKEPVFVMIIYIISYKEGTCERTACGDYYPVTTVNNKSMVNPHPYQSSICW